MRQPPAATNGSRACGGMRSSGSISNKTMTSWCIANCDQRCAGIVPALAGSASTSSRDPGRNRRGACSSAIARPASSPGGLDGFVRTLALYAHELRGMPCVVAINKSTQMDNALPAACQRNLREYGVLAPVIQVDARQRPDVSRIAQLLFTMLRYNTRVLAPVAAAS